MRVFDVMQEKCVVVCVGLRLVVMIVWQQIGKIVVMIIVMNVELFQLYIVQVCWVGVFRFNCFRNFFMVFFFRMIDIECVVSFVEYGVFSSVVL